MQRMKGEENKGPQEGEGPGGLQLLMNPGLTAGGWETLRGQRGEAQRTTQQQLGAGHGKVSLGG